MKFLCDRCNTRYSIGDDRVRGKILKVRCKNCSNVVTVREGMPNTDRPAGAPRTPTTVAAVVAESPAKASALGAAFASAMSKPPPALEEEWYVSIDGEQSGPFALADAQKWIAAKDHDAELHCWSEGFDDWLPVDKVGHFRNLRKQPRPPIPRVVGRAPASSAAAKPQDDKPMFAATMASLENTVHGLGAPLPSPARTAAKLAPTSAPSRPLDVRLFPAAGRPAPANGRANGAMTPAKGLEADPADSATQIDTSHFDPDPKPDPFATVAEPFGSLDSRPTVAAPDPFVRAPEPPPSSGAPEDNDLDIGEVSRVVNLGDLARGVGRQTGGAASIGRQTGGVAARGRTESGAPRTLGVAQLPPGALANGTSAAAAIFDPPVLAPMPAPPDAHNAHRRGMIALIAGAFVLIGIAVAVVFVFVIDHAETGGGGLGQVEEIDNTRPDLARPKRDPTVATPAEPPVSPNLPKVKRPTQPSTNQLPTTQAPTGNSLQAQEIEDMAGKYSSVTQRCHMRAQRGTDGVLLADVKKIAVTLTINGDGIVTDAQLSDNHATNTLGKCLLSSIRSWKFRPSPGGTFKFVLLFG